MERTGQIEAWLWVCFKAGAKSARGELGSGYIRRIIFIIRVRGEIDRSRPSNNSSNVPSMLSGFDLYKSWGSVNMLHVYVFFHCIQIITRIIKSTRVEVEHHEF